MYEYKSDEKKTAEALLAICLLLLSAASLAAAEFQGVFLAALLKLFAVICFLAAMGIAMLFLSRRYLYLVAPSDREDGSLDLTVTEYGRKTVRTVCCIALDDITEVLTPLEYRAKRKEEKQKGQKRTCFDYVGRIFYKNVCFVIARDGEDEVAFSISADERLISMLKNKKQQYLS